MRSATVSVCPDCHAEHLGRCGGIPWLDRLRSITLDTSATPTKTKRNYFDSGAVKDVFGEDSKERLYDETQGRGPAYRHPRTGQFVRKDRKSGSVVPLTDSDADFYVGAGTDEA